MPLFILKAGLLAHECQRPVNGAQHAQGQHVHLEQAQGIDVVLVPLQHRAVGHGGVLHGHEVAELVACNHKATHMLREMARKADQLGGQLGPPAQQLVRGHVGQRRLQRQGGTACKVLSDGLRQALGGDGLAIPPAVALGGCIDQDGVDAQGLASVSKGGPWSVPNDGSRQGRTVAAVLGVDVLDDLFAALVFKVDIDVGRFITLLGDETLKEHAHAGGIDLGDAQAIADRGVGCRATALAEDALGPCEGHDVVDREEVGFVVQFMNELELMLDLLPNTGGHALWVLAQWKAPAGALFGEVAQPLRGVEALGHDFVGVLITQFIE